MTAGLFAIAGIIIVIFIRQYPNQNHAKEHPNQVKTKIKDDRVIDLAPVLKKPYFYLCGICVFFTGFILQSTYSIAKSHMLDVGFDASYIVAVFSITSLLIAISKIINGFLTDRFGICLTYTLCCFFGVVATGALAFVSPDVPLLAWIFSVIDPFALPLETVMIPLLVAELFRIEFYPKILGYYLAINYVGFAIGVPFVNLFFDIFKTYKGILIVYAALLAVIMLVSFFSMSRTKKNKDTFVSEINKEPKSTRKVLAKNNYKLRRSQTAEWRLS